MCCIFQVGFILLDFCHINKIDIANCVPTKFGLKCLTPPGRCIAFDNAITEIISYFFKL